MAEARQGGSRPHSLAGPPEADRGSRGPQLATPRGSLLRPPPPPLPSSVCVISTCPTAASKRSRGIDLDVFAGEIFAFLGPNGAGKTTTVEILEGYRRRSAGEVRSWVLTRIERAGTGGDVSGWSCRNRSLRLSYRGGVRLALCRLLPRPRARCGDARAGRPGRSGYGSSAAALGGQQRRLDVAWLSSATRSSSSSMSRPPGSTRRPDARPGR